MRRFTSLTILLAVFLFAGEAVADSITFNGRKRDYQIVAPRGRGRMGVVVGLHCNGGNPGTIMGRWKAIVTKDNCIIVCPSSIAGSTNPWRDKENDGFEYVKAVVEDVARKYPVDWTRIYLVGYSAGACHACRIGVPNSDFFTGIIAFAGSSGQGFGNRKIPVALIHGTADKAVGFDGTQRLADDLKSRDWPLFFKPLEGAGHSYNPKFDREAWAFLNKHKVPPPPEMVAEEALSKATAGIKRKKYGTAWEEIQKAQETGVMEEEITKVIEAFNERGDKDLEKATGNEKKLTKMLKAWVGTPYAEKAQAALDELLAEEEPAE